MGEWGIFGSKINTFDLFSKSVLWIFLKSYLMKGIIKWVKVTVLEFSGKFSLCPKYGKWVIFLGPKSTLFNFSLNLFITLF